MNSGIPTKRRSHERESEAWLQADRGGGNPGGAFLSLLWPDLLAFFLIGGLSWRAPNIVLTKRGRYAWVVLMREFFTAVNNFRDYCRGQMARSA